MTVNQLKLIAAFLFIIAACFLTGLMANWLPAEHWHGAIGLCLLIVGVVVLKKQFQRHS